MTKARGAKASAAEAARAVRPAKAARAVKASAAAVTKAKSSHVARAARAAKAAAKAARAASAARMEVCPLRSRMRNRASGGQCEGGRVAVGATPGGSSLEGVGAILGQCIVFAMTKHGSH